MGFSDDHIRHLKDTLRRLRDLVELPLIAENPDARAKGWREEARDLCYDLEDAICKNHVISRSSSGDENAAPDDQLVQLAMAALSEFNKLSLGESSCADEIEDEPGAASFLVGMEDSTNKIIELLHVPDESDSIVGHRVVSIVGLGGSGKSTLAGQVYDKISGKFQCKARVSITRKPNVKGILIDLLWKLGGNGNNLDDLHDLTLVRLIQEHVQDKRFLLIVDDILDEDIWLVLRCALLQNYAGGRIIMTTRINDIASLCDNVYPTAPLSKENSKLLLLKRALDSEVRIPELEDTLDKILEKCDGLPLAIIAMSDVLKKEKRTDHWIKSYNSMNSADTEDSIKSMRRKLSIGYYELPYHLRMCLLYLSIFPARQVIKMKRLVHRWISQGIVCAQYGENVIELATDYFNELINTNWIEPVNIKSDGQARACRVHNAILDFLVYKSAEEHFVTLFSSAEYKEQKKIRNMSIQNVQDVRQLGEVSHVRSLTIFGSFKQLSSPLESDVLRVLDLEDCRPAVDSSGDENKAIVDASSLLHLRYLSIRAAGINGLDEEQITKMQHLETLDLRESLAGKVKQLDITGLQQLVRLLVDSKTELKGEIGNMKALEEVKYISVSKHSEEFLNELGQLTNLRVLGIHFDEQKKSLALASSSLHEHGNCALQSLHIDGIWEISLNLGPNGDSGKPTLPSLRKLKFQKWCYLKQVPAWMGLLKNLEKLRLGVSQMKQDELPILGGLPCLVDLFLDILEIHGDRIVFEKLTGFRYLRCLGISCRTRMTVIFESESVPCLEDLKVQLDVRDVVMPEGGNIILGIKHLLSLTRLDVSIYCIRKTNDMVKAVKDAVQKEAGDSTTTTFTENPEIDTDGGALMSHICEKFGNLKKDLRQVKTLEEFGIDTNMLQDWLQNMRWSLRTLSDEENPKQQVKEWRESVRELCYDMDDAIHIHGLFVEESPSSSLGGRYSYCHTVWRELKNGLDNMRLMLPMRTNRHLQLDMSEGASSSSSGSKAIDQSEDVGEAKMPAGCHSLSIDPWVEDLQGEALNLVGTDAQRDTIIKALFGKGVLECKLNSNIKFPKAIPPQTVRAHLATRISGPKVKVVSYSSSLSWTQPPRVVSIFGFAGVGKTALAKQVYHNIKGKFDCAAIVTVSRKLSLVNLMRHILSQFDPGSEMKNKYRFVEPLPGNYEQPFYSRELNDEEQFYSRKLKDYIRDKRFCVVLDDIWNENDWNAIASLLLVNGLGGSVITTTRIRSVAKRCCFQYNNGYLHEMKPLNIGDSKKLFLQRLFGSEKYPSYPEQACNEIVQNCGGSPLSILTVSSILAHNASPDRWEEILKSMASGISNQSGAEDMKRILSITYYDLPYPIRMCLLYLSIFPGGYEINRKDLINRWIADGLIEATGKNTKSVVGEYYFYELINRSLIQPVKIRYDGKVKACRVDSAILDFIVSKSTEENFVTIVGAQEDMSDNKIRRFISKRNKIRRLSIQNIQSADVSNLEMRNVAHVRSVALFGPVTKFLRYLKLCSATRVLSLEGKCLEYYHFRKFPRLEYLNCGPSHHEIFLEGIGELRCLKTLDLRQAHVSELPPCIMELRHLVRLLVPKDINLPYEIDYLNALEELKNVCIDREPVPFCYKLARLTKLRVLCINFGLSGISPDKEEDLISSLSRLGSLSLHSLTVDAAGEFANFDPLWKRAVRYLHKFSLRACYISKVPDWMDSLDRLKKLRLGVRYLDRHGLATLGRLQGLLDLYLDIHDITEDRLVCGRSISEWFPTLKYFCIRTSILAMSRLLFEEGVMPKVEFVKLELFADNRRPAIIQKGLDFGTMKHLKSLKKAHVTFRIDRPIEKEAMVNIVSAIRNGVKSNVNLKFETHYTSGVIIHPTITQDLHGLIEGQPDLEDIYLF
ncbi:hypothetical protein ACP4OV_003892 [Aristida adscensionis]